MGQHHDLVFSLHISRDPLAPRGIGEIHPTGTQGNRGDPPQPIVQASPYLSYEVPAQGSLNHGFASFLFKSLFDSCQKIEGMSQIETDLALEYRGIHICLPT